MDGGRLAGRGIEGRERLNQGARAQHSRRVEENGVRGGERERLHGPVRVDGEAGGG